MRLVRETGKPIAMVTRGCGHAPAAARLPVRDRHVSARRQEGASWPVAGVLSVVGPKLLGLDHDLTGQTLSLAVRCCMQKAGARCHAETLGVLVPRGEGRLVGGRLAPGPGHWWTRWRWPWGKKWVRG